MRTRVRSALAGERTQVTVLVADLKGSMELLAARDPAQTPLWKYMGICGSMVESEASWRLLVGFLVLSE
jgi:hypothetical protein